LAARRPSLHLEVQRLVCTTARANIDEDVGIIGLTVAAIIRGW
jgi:hypothetical protein